MRYPHGLIAWVDLLTRDAAAAKDFYCPLFGWTAEDIAIGDAYTYTNLRKDGQLVAGLGQMTDDMIAERVRSVWYSYVFVDDVDRVLDQVPVLHGVVLSAAMDVPGQGRMAMIADPGGAAFGVWEPRGHEGADVFDVPGALVWNELQSHDLGGSVGFYTTLFGWRWVENSGPGYLAAMLDSKPGTDKANAGAMAMTDDAPMGAPSWWAVYFRVEDCDTSVARAVELGGTVFLEPRRMGPGRFAGIADPMGALFLLGSF